MYESAQDLAVKVATWTVIFVPVSYYYSSHSCALQATHWYFNIYWYGNVDVEQNDSKK